MSYKINWVENKGADWKIVSLESGEKDVSVNRKDKKGVEFPNFDNLVAGMEIEAKLWTSPQGKHYLYPPEAPKQASYGGYKQKLMDETMAKKEASIGRFQDNKEEAIRLASAQRDAVLIVVNLYKEIAEDKIMTPTEKDSAIKKKIVEMRNYFLSKEFTDSTIPF